jgi:protein arginine N-methyltransferase 1
MDGVNHSSFHTKSHFLIYDSLIESVIFARDKYLAKQGKILPDRGVLFVASIEDEQFKNKKMEFW